MAIIDWTTNYPATQDSTPPTTEQPDLSNTTDETRVSQIATLRDKLDAVAKKLGDDGDLPAGSAVARLTALESTPAVHLLGSATHTADTLANLNAKISDATLIDTADSRLSDAREATGLQTSGATVVVSAAAPPTTDQVLKATSATTATWQDEMAVTAHALGGIEHNLDTLANLNAKISDATLVDTGDSRFSDDRTGSKLRTATTEVVISGATAPTAGQMLVASSTTLAAWATPKLDDLATPDDNTDLDATIVQHGLLPKLGGGTANFLRADGAWAAPSGGVPGAHDLDSHNANTLAELNAIITGGDLDYDSASRPPNGSASGDLSGTYPGPAVAAITTTTGPTSLTVGAVADGDYLKRVGSTVVGATPNYWRHGIHWGTDGEASLSTTSTSYVLLKTWYTLLPSETIAQLSNIHLALQYVAVGTPGTAEIKVIFDAGGTATVKEWTGLVATTAVIISDPGISPASIPADNTQIFAIELWARVPTGFAGGVAIEFLEINWVYN